MSSRPRPAASRGSLLRALRHDRRGAAAVEIAIVVWPFLLVMLVILQMGLYYMTQTALDSGLNKTATALRNTFNTDTAPTLPTASSLKSSVVSNSGGLIYNNSSLAVELRQFTSLTSAVVPIVDGTVDYGTSVNAVLTLRAQSSVVMVAPGFSSLTNVESTAIVRRQGQ